MLIRNERAEEYEHVIVPGGHSDDENQENVRNMHMRFVTASVSSRSRENLNAHQEVNVDEDEDETGEPVSIREQIVSEMSTKH